MKKAGIVTGVLALGVGAYLFLNRRVKNKLEKTAKDFMNNFNTEEDN